MFRNSHTAEGSTVVVPSANAVNYVALQVITQSDLTYLDGKGNQTVLTAVQAGIRIDCIVTQVTVASGTVLGYSA